MNGVNKMKVRSCDEKISLAKNYFNEGYNCSQSVFLAFCEDYGMDSQLASKISASFGGGMGQLREVCGAVTGMFMAAGLIYGYTDPNNLVDKAAHYERIQYLSKKFEEAHESIICRVLLENAEAQAEVKKSQERSCTAFVETATKIMAEYIESCPPL